MLKIDLMVYVNKCLKAAVKNRIPLASVWPAWRLLQSLNAVMETSGQADKERWPAFRREGGVAEECRVRPAMGWLSDPGSVLFW